MNQSFFRLQRPRVARVWTRTIRHLTLAVFFCLFASAEARAQQIDVEIITMEELGKPVPRVAVTIGTYSVTTDYNGRAKLNIPTGTYKAKVGAGCVVSRLNTSPNIEQSGPAPEPDLTFQSSTYGYHVAFIMRCGGDPPPLGTIRLKIATTKSCSDKPNEDWSTQEGVMVYVGPNAYTSNKNGVIEVDLPAGDYSIAGNWKDYYFAYVSQNGIKHGVGPDAILPTLALKQPTETLEVRMVTCDLDGTAKPRAVITEGGNAIRVTNIQGTKNASGFVGMQLRDGDVVTIRGHAKFKWLRGDGIITFDRPPAESCIIIISPDRPEGRQAPSLPSRLGAKFELLRGFGSFFFPKTEADEAEEEYEHDEQGNRIRWKGDSHSVVIGVKGTVFTFGHDDKTQVSTIAVQEGEVAVTPKYPGQRPFTLKAGQRAEVSPAGVIGPDAPPAQQGVSAKTNKDVYAPNERIEVTYFKARGFGNDYVVIVDRDPAKQRAASGAFSAINPSYQLKIGQGGEVVKPVRGTWTFPGLPEGEYQARYVDSTGNAFNTAASASFTVGNAPSPPPPPRDPGSPSPVKDLTGLWRNPGGNATYRLRQIGNRLYWGVDAVPQKSFANIYYGDIVGNTVDGIWIDLPGSPYVGDGKIFLRIESECRLVKTAEVNHYAAEVWVKVGSLCDVVGLPQRSDTTGTGNRTDTTTAKNTDKTTKPPTSEKPTDEVPDVLGKGKSTNQPPTDEKPDVLGKGKSTNQPPTDEVPGVIGRTDHPPVRDNTGRSSGNDKEDKPKEPNKPGKDSTGGTTGGGGTGGGVQPDGTCRGGSWWLGTPPVWKIGTPGWGVRVPWSAPIGSVGFYIRIWEVGTNRDFLNGPGVLPENPNYCGLSWSLYPQSPGDYDVYLYSKDGTRVAGPVRFRIVQ